MAQTAKSAQTGAPASSAPTNDSNGVITGSNGPVGTAVNRKKQKRRQKQAAKAAADHLHDLPSPSPMLDSRNGNYHNPAAQLASLPNHMSTPYPPGPEDPMALMQDEYDEPYDTEEEDQTYLQARGHAMPNGYAPPPPPPPVTNGTSKSSKKKKKNKGSGSQSQTQQHIHHGMAHAALTSRPPHHNTKDIWNSSTQEERERIRDFWLALSEDERKSLVKIEKEAVLKKMKEQQKHSCSCTVCGRKRNAIEEELELLYDAYYEELEGLPPDRLSPMIAHSHRPTPGRVIGEELDEDDDPDDEEELDEEEYSEDEYEDEDYSDEEPPETLPRAVPPEFLNFGNSLTVKGGILTVADDLLKNDGRKFIEMMEQLAERRMQREEEAQYASTAHPSSYQDYNHGYDAPLDDDEFDDDEDDDYDSQDDYDEEEEQAIDNRTEQQRMEEGRRMFQIFAARMFEQRVLTAYREKVALERQQRLLDDIDKEQNDEAERNAKKAAAAEKKKQKKQQAKQKQQEEKARKEAEKAAEEAAQKEAELKKQEEQRRKREEQRKKKELERKAAEEDKARKEAERFKRQQEERERQQDAERKAREQKAAEKKAKEDAKRKEREERESREKETKERKLQADRERKDREDRSKADKDKERETQEKSRREAAAQSNLPPPTQPAASRRPTAPTAVPIPPGLQKQPSNLSSPHIPIATPAMPKAPTPSRPRQASYQASKGSSPMTPQIPTGPSKSSSPASIDAAPQAFVPKSILQKPTGQISAGPPATSSGPTMHPIQPPPGMTMSPGPLGPPGFGPPPGVNGFHPMHSSMMPGIGQRGPFPPFGNQGMPFGTQHRPFGPPPGVPMPPPGLGSMGPMDRSFEAPPGLPQQPPGMRQMSLPGFVPSAGPTSSDSSHSRQPSGTLERSSFDSTVPSSQPIGSAGPISRPAPIKRPSSVRTGDQSSADSKGDVEELAKHLGSSALLDDSDEPFPVPALDTRRTSAIGAPTPGLSRGLSDMSTFSPFGGKPSQPQPFGLNTPAIPSSPWSASAGAQMTFGSLGATQSTWGSSPNNMWPAQSPLSFGGLGSGASTMAGLGGSYRPRPQQIRLNVCNACRQLAELGPVATHDGYVEASAILRFMDRQGQLATTAKEMIDICDTLGSQDNGGGLFDIKLSSNAPPETALIKFIASPGGASAPGGGPSPNDTWGGSIGQIGSPVLSSHHPHGGAPTPFGSLRGGFPGLGPIN